MPNGSIPAGPRPEGFDALEGWAADDHVAALACLRLGARKPLATGIASDGGLGVTANAMSAILQQAVSLPREKAADKSVARNFFETRFTPWRLGGGLLTGYYEPELEASLVPTQRFKAPLHGLPADLPPPKDGVEPTYHDRAAIRAGALDGRGVEIAWLEDPVDAFFAQIQGSVRLRLADGSTMRLGYAGKTGHPYTSIGSVLLQRGVMRREDITMDSLRLWLARNPDAAGELMDQNRSYIFFRVIAEEVPSLGPVGAAGSQLTPGRSLAVDRLLHCFGSPVWLESHDPLPHEAAPMRRLMIAQDTGSAIVGAARGDYFFGTGTEAGSLAGSLAQSCEFFLLAPVGNSITAP